MKLGGGKKRKRREESGVKETESWEDMEGKNRSPLLVGLAS